MRVICIVLFLLHTGTCFYTKIVTLLLSFVQNREALAFLKRRGQLFTITTDNGSEFMAFRSIEKALGVPVYFARPYRSTDKPHIEHLNALIRQYIPKGTSFAKITDKQIRDIEWKLNNRPRKKLNYKSPFEVFFLNLY